MSIAHRQNRMLKRPDKEYYDLWRELGTLNKVSNHLALLGEVNPKLQQPYSEMTIRIAAYRYVIEFPELVKSEFDKEIGRELTTEEWNEFLVKAAMSVYDTSTDKLKSWIRRKGMEKYDYIYSKRFPNGVLE
jgi:hypothetical protein